MLPSALFARKLSREELLALPKPKKTSVLRLLVVRNHAFEYVASILNIFLGQIGLRVECSLSPYDDSLHFSEKFFSKPHNALLLWLDAKRYEKEKFFSWLKTRLTLMEEATTSPIFVFVFGKKLPPNCTQRAHILDVDELLKDLGEKAFDERMAPIAGTRLSREAILDIARYLGFSLLPKFFLNPLKAIILDCDETLYKGVLEEEGVEGVQPYIKLQTILKQLKDQGFLLCLCSKNEESSLKNLFEKRDDFPLKWHDFATVKINWQKKSENIKEIAKEINIGTDALLLIDDNIGELLEVSNALPEVHLLPAGTELETLYRIQYYPFLQKNTTTFEDKIRSEDIAANQKRRALSATLTKEEYRKALKIHLHFFVNPKDQSARITELLNKTNQFIFCYLRPTQVEVEAYLTEKEKVCITCAMEDALTKSGVIACGLFEKKSDVLKVCELTVSCRALGRDIETGLLFYLINLACRRQQVEKIELSFQKGQKNGPALLWLKKYWPGSIEGECAIARKEVFRGNLEDILIDTI